MLYINIYTHTQYTLVGWAPIASSQQEIGRLVLSRHLTSNATSCADEMMSYRYWSLYLYVPGLSRRVGTITMTLKQEET